MTVTTPKRRVDFTVHPASNIFSPGPLVRIAALVLLLGFSSIAVAAAPEGSPESSPAASPQATPSADMPRLQLDLEELNDSGISGTVTLYDADDETIVKFDVEGAGGDHPAHIHAGTCGNLEPEPAFNLDNIDKEGASTTVVNTSLDDLLDGEYAIDVHLAPNELGTLIACANIEGEPEVLPNGTPEASPQSTPSAGVGGRTTTTPTETPTATTGSDGTSGASSAATVAATETETETPAPTQTTQATTTQSTMTGGQGDISDGTGGPGSAVPMPSSPRAITSGDGTSGVSGKGEPVTTTTLPQQTGVGSALAWPDNPTTAMIWASSAAAIVLGSSAWFIRRGERTTMTTTSRWTRMGI